MMRQDENNNNRNNNNGSQIYYAGSGHPASNMGYNVDTNPYNDTNQYYMSHHGGPGSGFVLPHDRPYIINTEPISINKDSQIILVDPPMEPYVKSYFTWSMFNVIFCFVFGGIITTIMSCNVMRLNDSKRYKEAFKLSGKVLLANMIVSAFGGLLFLIVFPYIYVAIYPHLPKINW